MPPSPRMNGQRLENGPYEVSPPSSDDGDVTVHETWLPGRLNQLPRNHGQQNHNNQSHSEQSRIRQNHNQQNHDQQFAPNWPFAPVALADLVNQRPSMVVPPNNTPVVTPNGSLEEVSLEGPRTANGIRQEQHQHHHDNNHRQKQHQQDNAIANGELERRLQASDVQLTRPASAEVLRPSSFEIMGCFFPTQPEQLMGTGNSHAVHAQPGPPRRNGSRFESVHTPTPRPSGAGALGSHILPHGSRQPSHVQFRTRRLITLIVASGLALASFLFLAQAVSVMTIFQAANKPQEPGYIVECVLSLVILFPSTAVLILVSIGKDIAFPYTVRSPFARRQPPQPKELELGSLTSRPATANNQDVERGEVQRQVVPQPAAPMSVPGPGESRVLLLRPAASNAAMAPSTTQTSIVTELCDAVTTPIGRP